MIYTVADIGECRKLYKLSGWGDTVFSWYCDEERDDTPALNISEPLKVVGGVGYYDHKYPAYDLSFLLFHIPACTLTKYGNMDYLAVWADHTNGERITGHSRHNAANALCRLATALIEAMVLRPSDVPWDVSVRQVK